MKKKTVLDKDEEELIAEYEHGAFRPAKNQNRARQEATEAAHRYTRKDASILHKYDSRSAPRAN